MLFRSKLVNNIVLDYDKSRRKHQNKEYNTSSKKMLTLGIGAAENKQNKLGVKLTIGRRKRFYFVVFSFTKWRGFIFFFEVGAI